METHSQQEFAPAERRVYHFDGLTSTISGRWHNKKFVKALHKLKEKNHCLVLHLARGEKNLAKAIVTLFDCVVEAPASYDLSPFKKELGRLCPIGFDEVECSLRFNTLGGSQQYTESYLAYRQKMETFVKGKVGLRLEETLKDRWSKLRIVEGPSWETLHKERGWEGWRYIRVAVNPVAELGEIRRGHIMLKDKSMKEVSRVAKELHAGRPWGARRGGRRGMHRGSCR